MNRSARVILTACTLLAQLNWSLASAPPPAHAGAPLPRHAATNRAFQGISSLAVAPNGRLWATWYAGHTPGEDHNNYVVLATSGDNGTTWQEILTVDPDGEGPRRTFDPEVWIAPDGKLRLFWCDREMPYKNVATDALWLIVLDDPNAADSPWHPPSYVTKGVMMCKPLVLSSGEWALPVCTWFSDNSSKIVVSTDAGKSWSVRGGADLPAEVRTFDEHMFIERKDGSLWCLSRTKTGIHESFSSDRGKSWTQGVPSKLQHPSARFFISRLASGNLLLVKHGPLFKKTGRSHLTAYLSKDDGRNWEGGLLLDERSGISYPDGQQTADGTIYLTYDFSRTDQRHILFTTFKEEDVLAGKPVSGAVRLRQLISQGSGGQERPKPKVRANADGTPLVREGAGGFVPIDAETDTLAIGTRLFSNRNYTLAELPEAFLGAKFLRLPLDGNKRLQCQQAGMLYVLTPLPDRNQDSLLEELTKQGFKKVAIPEIRLFDPPKAQNFTTLFQKKCAADEIITIGKWGVPLFFDK